MLKETDPSALEPDVTVVRSLADFLNGGDPVLDAALKSYAESAVHKAH
ncbi:MAG TPA: hypothetical protein VI636_13165 [Candidatus Angelobacter sp.]